MTTPILSPTLAVPTEADIYELLRNRHQGQQWAFFGELRMGTGYGRQAEQRLDGWEMNLWPSGGFERITYEIKVSRSDFLRELREPRKRRMGLLYSNFFYFVTPQGLLRVEEIPPECGLIEVQPYEVQDNRGQYLGHWLTPDQRWRGIVTVQASKERHASAGLAIPGGDCTDGGTEVIDPTTVVNVRTQEFDVYIGRANRRYGLMASPFGNPFKVEAGQTREQVIARYREWILSQPDLLAQLPALRGQRLGCWCKPLACHGDVLAELADASGGSDV